MTAWQTLAGSMMLHVPIALRAVDDFTGRAPVSPVQFALDRQNGTRWIETSIDPVRSTSGIIAWPGLGRVQDPATAPVAQYRVRFVDPDDQRLYRPAYGFQLDGLTFAVSPWNDVVPPAAVPVSPELVFLQPGVRYPFPRAIPLLRGRTLDSGGNPLVDARVTGTTDHVLSDQTGSFCLPIRLATAATSLLVIADHNRTGTSGDVTVALPGGLASNVNIQLV